MSGQDIALAREIAFGVARHRRWLEEVLARYLHKPLPTQAHQVRDALFMGIYQAAHLDRVPAHTIVDETVKLVGSVRSETGYRALANAIMRKVVAAPREELHPTAETPWHLIHGVPQWLSIEAGQLYRGGELVDFFAACNLQAPLCLRATMLAGDVDDDALLTRLIHEIETHVPSNAEVGLGGIPRSFLVRGRGITPDHLPSFRAGLFTVEDEGAQIVSQLTGAREGDAVLDLCASPGGKTSNIADIGRRNFKRLVACDVNDQKLARLHDTLKRLHLMDLVTTRLAGDALREERENTFDVVLVDAPCSALGTMRRHPEVRWKRSARDLRILAKQQQEILGSAARFVKPGGALVYSVCTFTRTETDSVVDRFLAGNKSFSAAGAPDDIPFDVKIYEAGEGRWRTAPHRNGCDGFFVARMRKCADQ
ncbi:hypothetical protein IT570_10730 [Candidatus Sumerlaeota bacterium]|nr:hypothetical protein [Candidatus Sumerlaeota bacterium]